MSTENSSGKHDLTIVQNLDNVDTEASDLHNLPHDPLGPLERQPAFTSRPHTVNPLKYLLGLLDCIGDGEV